MLKHAEHAREWSRNMPRKPAKAKIDAALSQYVEWMKSIGPRIDAIPSPERRKLIYGWTNDVLDRIQSGELGSCTSALIRSVVRECENWESGYYTHTENGGRTCAIAAH